MVSSYTILDQHEMLYQMAILIFRFYSSTDRRTDGQTDRQTDRQTCQIYKLDLFDRAKKFNICFVYQQFISWIEKNRAYIFDMSVCPLTNRRKIQIAI